MAGAGYPLKNKRVVVTCGPTWVPIDMARVISNTSTGALGQRIALDCAKVGAQVTLLEGPVARPLVSRSIRILKFLFFEELQRLLRQELQGKVDALIHAAAVADYKLRRPFGGKLASEKKGLTLKLIATPKLISLVKRLNPSTFLVGFKLEPQLTRSSAGRKAVSLFREVGCDLVVANQSDSQRYKGYIIDNTVTVLADVDSREQLSAKLVRILGERL